MPWNPSTDTFDPDKNRVKLLYSRLRPLADSELNEQQDIERFLRELQASASFGSGPVGDAFTVMPTGVANTLLVLPGYGYNEGQFLRLLEPYSITGLATPGAPRTDYVYLEWWLEEVDSVSDPTMINPDLGVETAVREEIKMEFGVSEGTPIPFPPIPGHHRVRVAKLDRVGAIILAGEITDERIRWRHTYVTGGLRCQDGGALNVSVDPGEYWAGGTFQTYAGGVVAVPNNARSYIVADDAGVVTWSTVAEFNEFQVVIADVLTSAGVITEINDRRFWTKIPPLEKEIELARGTQPSLSDFLLNEHNPDGTHNALALSFGSIDRDNWLSLQPDETVPPSLSVRVRPGRYTTPSGEKTLDFPGTVGFAGTAPDITFPAPTGPGDRIDLLTIDEFGALQRVQGTYFPVGPAQAPVYPEDQMIIAEVLLSGATPAQVADIRDVRPFLNMGRGGGSSTFELYEYIPSLPHVKYDPGTRTFTLDGYFNLGDHSLMVYRNGKYLVEGSDYIELPATVPPPSGPAGQKVQLLFSPNLTGTNQFEFIVYPADLCGSTAPNLYEVFNTTGGETLFTFTSGYYSPSLDYPSIQVFRNGKRLVPNTEFLQTSPNQVTLNGFVAAPGDIFVFIAYAAGSTVISGAVSGDPASISGTVDPNGIVIGVFGQEYLNTTTGVWYKCISYPSGTSWLAI